MPRCCYDENVAFAYDFEDGAPLTAYFENIIGSLSVVAGVGSDGSKGLQSTLQYDELTKAFADGLDKCGNPRRTFCIGGHWNVDDDTSAVFFYIAEIRRNFTTLYSFYQEGPDLVIFLGSGVTEVYRVANAFETGTVRKIEIKGSVSTTNEGIETAPFGNRDGSLEVRINNRVYPTGSDFDAIDPNSEEDECSGGVSGLQSPTADLGWNKVVFSPHGVLDCVYISEDGNYCNEPPPNNPPIRCPEPGPGGSSFEGQASGTRAVQLGGAAASYSAPTGGGRLPTASDPADAQTTGAITVPVVTLDITLPDATVKRYGFTPVPRSGAAPAEGRLVRVSDVPYPLSDRFGSMPGQSWEVGIADPDGDLRAILGSGANRFFKRWEGILYIEDDAARQAGTARRKLARGRAVSVNLEDDLVVAIKFSDEFSRHDSAFSLDRELPHVLVSDVFRPGLSATGMVLVTPPADDILKLPTPILLGECSDERRIEENPPVTPIGICRLYDVGDYTLNDGNVYVGFLVCLYAVKSIPSLFASNLHPNCPSSVRMEDDVFSSGEFLVPGKGSGAKAYSAFFSTKYIDITVGGVTYRVTMVFGRGPRAQAHREGKVPVSANVNGVENTGDTTGTMIDDLAYVVEFMLEHPILRQTTGGNWGSYAAFADGASKVRHSTFTTAKALLDDRLSGGYEGALLMYERRSARDWLAEALVCADMRLGINHHGQVVASVLDFTPTLSSLTTFRDNDHVRDGSFRITSELNSELENSVSWEAGPEPSSGRTSVAKETTKSAESIDDWGEAYKGQELLFAAIYKASTARDLAGRRVLATLDGVTRGEFVVDLAGGDLTQGQLIRSTDFRGLGATGWTDRLLRVLELSAMVNPDEMSYLVQWEDVNGLLLAPGTTSTSAYGFGPVGDAMSGGWVVGDSTSGGYRVG